MDAVRIRLDTAYNRLSGLLAFPAIAAFCTEVAIDGSAYEGQAGVNS